MTLRRKPLLIILLTFAGFLVGFFVLLRGCLARYDERFIKTPALVIEKQGRQVIFTIVEFQKTTSYSQKGGSINKSVNTQYYVQTNDGETADLMESKKIKGHRQIKNYPVEVLGASGTVAWIFMGEPMAFDAFTLALKADTKILEEKNPSLKGKLPAERQFYHFNRDDKNIYFTATDGSKWQLNTQTLLAAPSTYQKDKSPLENKLASLEQDVKNIDTNIDSLFQQKTSRATADYAAKKISYAAYQQSLTEYYTKSTALREIKDSLDSIKRQLEKDKRKTEDRERAITNMQRSSLSFSQTKANQDTSSGTWFGLYGEEELNKLSDRVNIDNAYDETMRRNLFISDYSFSKNSECLFNKPAAKNISSRAFLDGGFLLNKETAMPIHPAGNSFLVVYKDIIGKDGKIVIADMTRDGKLNWTYNTRLTQWTDWILTGNRLYIFGVNNKNLSSGESNILVCLHIEKGTASVYDYFSKKKTE